RFPFIHLIHEDNFDFCHRVVDFGYECFIGAETISEEPSGEAPEYYPDDRRWHGSYTDLCRHDSKPRLAAPGKMPPYRILEDELGKPVYHRFGRRRDSFGYRAKDQQWGGRSGYPWESCSHHPGNC